ncbi:porin [Burkholderia cenocepacia]|uniref:porin n=1 Tax=Burkholderia cenocepacia TaxID=95486 RepID=UPI0015891E6D|nr:porin [Burkholderia cenocepacia]MBR8152899.1 porin [Burkholderia cenocepacia]MCA8084492.1 porin [Burkholderia cenocepacia]HEB3533269.1 porin [Burkholderia cenocepacia]
MRLKYFAWLIAAATPAAAFAQTSVTLYGRIDGGVEYLNHIAKPNGGSGTRWSAESGDWGTSMFGLKGVEDLGGGLSTVFNLETAFQVMNGQTGGGRMWSRRAYVGLKSDTWGQLQAGRNLFIDSDGVWEFDPFVQQAFSSASLVRGRNWQQTSNNIEYHSPVIGGFDVQAQYAFGNQSRGFNYGAPDDFGRSDGIMISYHSPVLDVRGIYDELRDNNGKFSNIFTASREYFVGANVKVSKFKIQGAYTHYQAPDSPAGVADRADHYWLGATYSATPQWAVTGGGYYVKVGDGGGDASHDPSGHAMMYVLGTTYNLSKRTFLYGTVAYVRNGGNSNFSLLATPRDATSGTSPMTGESQTGAYVGMMHTF